MSKKKKSNEAAVRPGRSERRVGNYVFADLPDRVSVRDTGGAVSFSVSKGLAKGLLLSEMLSDGGGGLRGVAAVTWNFLSVVPDMEFLEAVNRLCVDCMGRHPEFYGVIASSSDADHASALADVRSAAEAAEGFATGEGGVS